MRRLPAILGILVGALLGALVPLLFSQTHESYRVAVASPPNTADWLAILGGSGIGAALGGVVVASLAGRSRTVAARNWRTRQ